MSIAAMKQALEALEQIKCSMFHPAKVFTWDPSIIALRAAIEQAEKPVAWVCEGISSDEKHSIDYQQEDIDALPVGTMLYTTPPAAPRQWVGLTDEEIKEIIGPWGDTPIKGYTRMLFDRIEAKLKEKNT